VLSSFISAKLHTWRAEVWKMTVFFLNLYTPSSSRQYCRQYCSQYCRQYCSHPISFSSSLIRFIASWEDGQSNKNLTEAALIYKFVLFPYYCNHEICRFELVKICQHFSHSKRCLEFHVKVVNFQNRKKSPMSVF